MSNRCNSVSANPIDPLITSVNSVEFVLPEIHDWFEVL
jgi:hypothetical protein